VLAILDIEWLTPNKPTPNKRVRIYKGQENRENDN
jgi:hypothetical protein